MELLQVAGSYCGLGFAIPIHRDWAHKQKEHILLLLVLRKLETIVDLIGDMEIKEMEPGLVIDVGIL